MAYQLGNLASSASSTIESTIGEKFSLYNDKGLKIDGKYDYAKVMAIFMGCVFGYLLLITLVGPENKGADLAFKDEEEKVLEDGSFQSDKLATDHHDNDSVV